MVNNPEHGRQISPLNELLSGQSEPIEIGFAELGHLVGGLPRSARIHQAWWGNETNPSSPHKRAWVDAGFVVDSVDLSAGKVWFSPAGAAGATRRSNRRPDSRPVLDGVKVLAETLRQAGYASTMHAVASHTVFLDPATVAQTGGAALFPVARDPARRGQFGQTEDGLPVLWDDNTSPTKAFCWAAQQRKGPDVQFNHVYDDSKNPAMYTALWNLCVTPAFLAKTTDGRNHPEVIDALRFRSFELYGFHPPGDQPSPPARYAELTWATSPPPIENLETVLRNRLQQAPKSRPTSAARQLGWLFSDHKPDTRI